MKKKIYYVMDTMCGWCYGFSDVISKIENKYKDHYDFSILPGGMWTGNDVKKMNEKLGSYIKGHNVKVEELTGKKFGVGFNENILGSRDVILDSLPGAKALVAIQRVKPEIVFPFLRKVQEAFFVDGQDPNRLEVYFKIAEEFQIKKEVFAQEFQSEIVATETEKVFAMVASMGAISFPTVIEVMEGKGKILSQGYSTFEELDGMLSRLA